MTTKTITRFALLTVLLCTSVAAAQSYSGHSLLASGNWHKIPISQTGVYKIIPSDIASLNGANCNSILVCGAPGSMLSTDNTLPHPDDLAPAAIRLVDANGNGKFDGSDYLLFYAETAQVWRYNEGDQRFEYTPHAYENTNFYYVGILSGTLPDAADATARIGYSTVNSSNRGDISTCTDVVAIHQDKINPAGSGQQWMADKFTSSLREHSYTLTLSNITQGNPILARYGLAAISSASSQFEFKYNSDVRQHTLSAGSGQHTFLESFTARNNREITLTLTFTPRENNAEGYFDFIEFNTLIPIAHNGGQSYIRNCQQLGSGNSARFVCSGSGSATVWDVTDPVQPQEVSTTAGGSGFSFFAATDIARTFVVFDPSSAFRPSGITAVTNQDIHGTATPDYVIVSHPDFLNQAERLADLHRTLEGLDVLVLTPEQVYNEFSSGKADPVAIRQMMRCMRSHSDDNAAPRYLLLFGKGTYDNRDILGAHQRTVVTYQTPVSIGDETASFASDDIFGYLDDNAAGPFQGTLSVSIGRLPAKSPAEAAHFVDKIEGYMERHDLSRSDIRGDWRNSICLLSDDADPSCPGDTNFATSSEKTARLITQRYPHFNIDRIYADAYIQQSGADGSYYPDVNNALRQRMNYGCLLLNYIGHGSTDYIGTERYVTISDIEKYTNDDRLAFVVTSTCSFGRYDQVESVSGAETYLLADAAGVGIISACRPISHIQQFNTNTCLFALDPANAVGDALRLAKNATSTSHSILLLGDPALHLSIPQNQVAVTHINGHPVADGQADSAEVLSRVTVSGEIRDKNGALMSDFNGEVFPVVFDRQVSCRTLANDNDSTEVDFVQQKNVLYKGREKVQNGKFTYSFIVPRDVAYKYDYAKLSHYARSDRDDATGAYSRLMLGGFNENMEMAELHPQVRLFINDSLFRNGGMTNENPTLFAHLTDSVGINAAGSGLGHDITAIIDGNPYSIVTLNDFYEADIDDSRNGTVRYTLGKLDNGPHTLTVKCWNIFNYSGSASISFYVANDRTAQIGAFSAAPNPAHDRTTLRIEHNQPGGIQSASIDIYNMRGGLVRHVDLTPADGSTLLCYHWDYTGPAGSLLPRGIYAARATIVTSDGEQLVQVTKIVRD